MSLTSASNATDRSPGQKWPSPKPLKALLPEYCDIEDRVMAAIAKTFKIEYPFPKAIKEVDIQMLFAERNRLIGPPVYPWIGENEVTPAKADIQCWKPIVARRYGIV